jgi:hypothetical protein
MTLLITVIAAVVSTALWYTKDTDIKLDTLSLFYWGASLMWFVDAFVEFLEIGTEAFTPPLEAMIYDAYLGCSVVALGLVVWIILLVIKDPKGKIRLLLKK